MGREKYAGNSLERQFIRREGLFRPHLALTVSAPRGVWGPWTLASLA